LAESGGEIGGNTIDECCVATCCGPAMKRNDMMLPNLIIIGAMKCGTTSLHEYLNLHPQICMSRVKEPAFFIEEHTWHKGLDWYRSIFPNPALVMGESSTSYTKYPTFKGVPERMVSILPDAKLIYLVRDPVERIVSQYVHMVAYHGENRSIEEAVRGESNDYILYSRYFLQLSKFLDYYPLERICIVSFEDLRKDKRKTMCKLFEFLGVDTSFESERFEQVHNRSAEKRRPNHLKRLLRNIRGFSRLERHVPWLFNSAIERPRLDESLKQRLIGALHKDIVEFKMVTGLSFDSWCL